MLKINSKVEILRNIFGSSRFGTDSPILNRFGTESTNVRRKFVDSVPIRQTLIDSVPIRQILIDSVPIRLTFCRFGTDSTKVSRIGTEFRIKFFIVLKLTRQLKKETGYHRKIIILENYGRRKDIKREIRRR